MTFYEQHPEPLEDQLTPFINNSHETSPLPLLPTQIEDFIGPSILAQLKWLEGLDETQKFPPPKHTNYANNNYFTGQGGQGLEDRILYKSLSKGTPLTHGINAKPEPYLIKSLFSQMNGILHDLPEQHSHLPDKDGLYTQSPSPDTELLNPPGERLSDRFVSILSGINFADVAAPKRKNKPVTEQVTDLDQYRLVPVRRLSPAAHTIVRHTVEVPAGVRTSYGREGGSPFLDTTFAVGLVYRDWLVAIGGARRTSTGDMLVRQLQDVSGVRRSINPALSNETGLRNGFWWRDTLVKVWEQMAQAVGADGVTIQSNANNLYPAVNNADGRGYDDVARRMHYTQQDSRGNWTKPA